MPGSSCSFRAWARTCSLLRVVRSRSDPTSSRVSEPRVHRGFFTLDEVEVRELALAVVRDLRLPTGDEELADFETDALSGFVLARASAGLADSTIRNDTNHLELIRDWFGRPLWEMRPTDADNYFGKVLRDAKPATRTSRAAALTVFFRYLERRHKVERRLWRPLLVHPHPRRQSLRWGGRPHGHRRHLEPRQPNSFLGPRLRPSARHRGTDPAGRLHHPQHRHLR